VISDVLKEQGDALLPVLAERSRVVEDHRNQAFPKFGEHSLSIKDWSGWVAGQRQPTPPILLEVHCWTREPRPDEPSEPGSARSTAVGEQHERRWRPRRGRLDRQGVATRVTWAADVHHHENSLWQLLAVPCLAAI
jgi:hypothetical protein